MSTQTQDDLEKLRAEMAQLRADLGRIGQTLQTLVKDGGADAVGKAKETAEKFRDEIAGKTQRIAQEIEQRPLTSAVTAFGLGFLLGLVLHGRRGGPGQGAG